MRALGLIGILGGALVAGAAMAQPPPVPGPIDSQLPSYHEEQREQKQVVPQAQSEEHQLRAQNMPQVYSGRVIQSDPNTRTLAIATPSGPAKIHLSPGAKVTVNGQAVQGLQNVPEGESVRATLRPSDTPEQLEIHVMGAPNGPNVQKPNRFDQPTVNP